jgi:heat shock protein HslJ
MVSIRGAAVAVLLIVAVSLAGCSGGRSRALDNSSWKLTAIGGEAVAAPAEPTVVFRTGGAVSGLLGCNTFYADAEVGEETIEFRQLGQTAMACPDPAVMQVEGDYMAALQGVKRWSVDRDTLVLSGTTELAFSRA